MSVQQSAQGGAGASGSAQSTTEQAKERVQETAQQVGQKAQEVRTQAGERVRQELDVRSTQAGEQVTTTADAIRRVGQQLRQESNEGPAKYADQVAERVERLGSYLTQANADRLLRDVENLARRQPWLAAFGGAAIGFLASRFVKASSAQRYEEFYGANGAGQLALPPGGTSEPAMASFSDSTAAVPPTPGGGSGGYGQP
jgi:ElaB/YqjD/DUF883 family membrane-anchored ribosome-binding protein